MLIVETRGPILIIKLTGELERDELAKESEVVEQKLSEIEEPTILLDLRRYEGAHDLGTAWRELKLMADYGDKVRKVAVIGLLDWQKLATHLVAPFTKATEKFFEPDEIDDAFEWLRV